jgi:acyl-CoA thioesterase
MFPERPPPLEHETSFDTDIAVEPLGEDRFRANLSERWWVGGGPNGGYVAAIMLNAMAKVAAAAGPDQPPRSLTVHFLAAPSAGEAEVEVTVERAGRNTSFISSRMLQAGEVQAKAMAVFSADRDGKAFDNSVMPKAPPPEQCEEFDTEQAPVAVFARYRVMLAMGDLPYSGGEKAETGGWIRLKEDRPVTAELAAAILDVWFPAPFVVLDSPGLAPTLEYTVHFPRRLPVAGREDPDWMLVHLHADESAEGHFTEDAELWTRDGTLVARSRQMALFRQARE